MDVSTKLKKSVYENKELIFIVLLAAIVRFFWLGLRPFDGDEGIILKMASESKISNLLLNVAADVHPPIFHILQFISDKIFSLNEFTARIVSTLSGIASIFFIFKYFLRKTDLKTALAISLLAVFSSVLAYHSGEVRPYALFTAIFFGQLLVLDNFLNNKSGLKNNFYLVILSALLVFTQYLGFIVLFGEFLYILIKERKKIWQSLTIFLSSVVIFAIFWGKPFIGQLIGRLGEQSQATSIKDNIVGLINAIYRFGTGRLFLDLDFSVSKNVTFLKSEPLLFIVFVLSILIPLSLLVYGFIISVRKKNQVFELITAIAVPLILFGIASNEIGPRAVRYFSFMVPFYLYFIVIALKRLNKINQIILGAVFLSIYISAFVNQQYFERLKVGVNDIAEHLHIHANDGDALVIQGGYGGGESFIAKYYLEEKEKAQELHIYDLYNDYTVGNLEEIKTRKLEDSVANAEGSTVWFYDLTYSFKRDSAILKFEANDLGLDKEGKHLILYKYEKNNF